MFVLFHRMLRSASGNPVFNGSLDQIGNTHGTEDSRPGANAANVSANRPCRNHEPTNQIKWALIPEFSKLTEC